MLLKENLRIVQLIDSLEPGGAERMAITIANTFGEALTFSALVVTRLEGSLKTTLSTKVKYCFLRKKHTLDIAALLRLRYFVKHNKVNVIHAHGSSYFFAVLLKITHPKLKIFWHDHLGNRVNNIHSNTLLQWASYFFSGVFAVNTTLQEWALQNLKTSNVHFIPNFIEERVLEKPITFLKGTQGKRIVLLANLRPPKNHLFALKAFAKSEIAKRGWTLHFIGKDNLDVYSNQLKEEIAIENLSSAVFLYGSCIDVSTILKQANVGLLTSTAEGFPVTLLEYGNAKLLVITSNVGYCHQIISNKATGMCFESNNLKELISLFKCLENNTTENDRLADNLNIFVTANYSASKISAQLLLAYQKEE